MSGNSELSGWAQNERDGFDIFNAGVSPSGFLFFSFFFFQKKSVALLKLWEVEDYADLGTPCPRNLTIT